MSNGDEVPRAGELPVLLVEHDEDLKFAAPQVPDVARASVIAAYFAGLGAHDWTAVAALCSDSVSYHLPSTEALGRTIKGRAAFRAHAAEVFQSFPGARFDVTAISWLPRGAVASHDGRWSMPGDQIGAASGAVYFQFSGTAISAIGVRTDIGKLLSLGSEARASAR